MTKPFYLLTKGTCKFCTVSKNLLTQNGHKYKELDITDNPALRAVVRKAGFTTVPVIYHGEELVGGYVNLVEYLASLEGIEIDQAAS